MKNSAHTENKFRAFAEVILPLALPGYFTYGIPDAFISQIQPGTRVEVQFGKQKEYSAIVRRVIKEAPANYSVKPILGVLNEEPLVSNSQLRFWEWIADYYLCGPGEVMNAALPAGLKLESETKLLINPEWDHADSTLSDSEFLVAEALTLHQQLSVRDVQKILDRKNVRPVLASLLQKEVLILQEELKEGYRPRKETCIKWSADFSGNESAQKELVDSLEKKWEKQFVLLMNFILLLGKHPHVMKSELLERSASTESPLNTLIKNGVLEKYPLDVSRLNDMPATEEFSKLTPPQEKSFDEIEKGFAEKKPVLLHGVTSSGKTLIYIRLIREQIARGNQSLYLLPEIALTTQIIDRLRKVFGNQIGVYHSRLNSSERVETWLKIQRGEYAVIIGARSALFLPFQKLGLVIVDEEHDSSFKQFDPSPRYQARDAALVLAAFHKGNVLLGSATPSIESMFNAQQKKYFLVNLTERYGKPESPEIEIVDLKDQYKRKEVKSNFSTTLLEQIGQALENKNQVLLFQNRRGFAPFVQCATCAWVPHCPNCDVSLTLHKHFNEMRCHYCGSRHSLFKQCPACKGTKIEMHGFGTEKIEDDLQVFFPDKKIARMDADTVRTKQGHEKILSAFLKKEIDILVGTQMVTKGLDFENLTLVGIMNADQLLNFPDYRASERAYQLMAQVSGRAGRHQHCGKVVVQAMNIKNPLLGFLTEYDYENFYKLELAHRQKFSFPPFVRMILLTLKHKEKEKLKAAADDFCRPLREALGKRITGPAEPTISRVKGFYLRQILIRLEKTPAIQTETRTLIRKSFLQIQTGGKHRGLWLDCDVDPG